MNAKNTSLFEGYLLKVVVNAPENAQDQVLAKIHVNEIYVREIYMREVYVREMYG